MGRKKRKLNVELKPFCYYCDREFDDEKVLIQHQKAKHFKCTQCNRKLDLASGLVVHMMQVHKTNLKAVPNALPKRSDPELIIRGMSGVPTELIEENVNKIKEEIGEKIMKRQVSNQWAQQQKDNARMEAYMQQMNPNAYSYNLYNSYPMKNLPNYSFTGPKYVNPSEEINKGMQNVGTHTNMNTISLSENHNLMPVGNHSSNMIPNTKECFLNPRETTQGIMSRMHGNNALSHVMYLQEGINLQTNVNTNPVDKDVRGIHVGAATTGNHTTQQYQFNNNEPHNLLSFANATSSTHPLQHIQNALYNSDQAKKTQNEKAIENKNSKMNDIKSTIKNNILMHKQNLLGKVMNQNTSKKSNKDMIFENNKKEEGKEIEKEKEEEKNDTNFSKEIKENEKEKKQDPTTNENSKYTYTNVVVKKVKLSIPPPDPESTSNINILGNVKLHYNEEISVNQMKAMKEFNWEEDKSFRNRITMRI